MRRAPGSDYCGIHRQGAADARGARVPCPVDPSHTVNELEVAKHVPRCPSTKISAAMVQQPCCRQGGWVAGLGCSGPATPMHCYGMVLALAQSHTHIPTSVPSWMQPQFMSHCVLLVCCCQPSPGVNLGTCPPEDTEAIRAVFGGGDVKRTLALGLAGIDSEVGHRTALQHARNHHCPRI